MFEKQIHEVSPGINYEYVYIPASDPLQPTLLFLHGFPSSFYCWRHQIKYFSEKGYACLAPNLMGYGQTYSPLDSNQYRAKSMVDHLVKILDHLSIDKVIVVGHDWGTFPATRVVLHHPDRVHGLILLAVGYLPPTKFDYQQALQQSKQVFGYETFGYWEFFASDDAEQIIQQNIESFVDLAFTNQPELWKTDFAPLGKVRQWLTEGKKCERASFTTEEDMEVFREIIKEGMQPKLNWYRAAINGINWQDEEQIQPTIDKPVLYLAAKKDFICLPMAFAQQSKFIKQLETREFDTSHWIMEENPEETNQTIENWINQL